MKGKLIKGGLTVLGAVVISTLGIFASDRMQGIDRELVGLSSGGVGGACPSDMTLVETSGGKLCVDIYESSASIDCPHPDPENIIESEENANADNCYAASAPKKLPWRFISLPQAQRMCAEAGKRLPTSDEWYRLALGTEPAACAINERAVRETGNEECRSSADVYDTIGNVWEWIDVTIVDQEYDDRKLPEEGYVASVDASGVAITSSASADMLYGDDYFWSKGEGVFGMIRGGFYGSGDDAGLYAVNASVPTSFASQGVGFRCVEDV